MQEPTMGERRVIVSAPAKINLYLGVGPRRDDGFHDLATLYQAVGLYDEITVSAADADLVRVVGHGVDVSEVPADESNIAMRAARLLAEAHGLDRSVEILIDKSIPVAGGMAGGSTDAAATLLACDVLWDLHLAREELIELAAALGSDVPFCLVGGTALGSGRGEMVTPVMERGKYWWVIIPEDDGLATAEVYAAFDRINADRVVPAPHVPEQMLAALRSGDSDLVGDWLGNDLQGPALSLRPELSDVLQAGLDSSAHGALVSGSGPTTLFLAESRTHAGLIEEGLRAELNLERVIVAPAPVPGAHVVGVGR
jgi:4-diphosphocytidyl-2-C-methyl-D-erythritol kinase